jgi:cytochrome P450
MAERPPVADWATDFDPLDPDWVADPYKLWREMRERCPVAHTERFMGVYFASRYADVRDIAYDSEHFSSRRLFVREHSMEPIPAPPITSDPPDHRADRMVLLPAFTPNAVKRLEPHTRTICRDLVARLAGRCEGGRGECDGAEDYAQEIPTRVTARLLGISEEGGARFRRWIRDFFEKGITDSATAERVVGELIEFFDAEIARRKRDPGDDLCTYLLNVRRDGERLSDAHINGTLRLMLFAGIDTTWSAIGTCLWHLASHDEDRRRLAADPDLIPNAVEEMLRAYSPVTMAREIVKETEIGGVRFAPGEMALLSFPAANRDPAMFPDPDRIDITRGENRHAAFGLGIHRCIGAHLARLDMIVALEEWLKAFPEFGLAPGELVEWSAGTVRGPRRLRLVLGSRGGR